ncbi:MAG: Cyclic di-GMP phosphodiesterase response regulator RpfG [Firmicutes bacterium]|nr:Cyclic di-GMP phosphodiesterase response regulator RpfG [Bacillota bacterium]
MRRISTEFLTPGMVVGRSIYNSRGQVLLREGTVITKRYIERLTLLGAPCVYIKDARLQLPFVIDVLSNATRVSAMIKVRNILEEAEIAGIVINPSAASATVKDMVAELLRHRNTVVNLTDIRLDDDYLFAHSVNTCVMALLAGISLGYTRERLHDLGLGALFHDAGKILVPKAILNKPGHLSPAETEIVRQHPVYGLKVLKDLPVARDVAYRHHERHDGSGYPRGISGSELDELSQLTGMADIFDALTANRQYRPGHPPREAYEYLAAGGNVLFELSLVTAFLKNVAAYPCGEVVELSDQSIAIVLGTAYGFPLHPMVRHLYSGQTIALATSNLDVIRVLPPGEAEPLLRAL